MKKIILFNGKTSDFNELLKKDNVYNNLSLSDLINFNASTDIENLNQSQNLVIYSDNFASVKEHVILNFLSWLLSIKEIENLYIQNAPKKICEDLNIKYHDIIQNKISNYYFPNKDEIINFYNELKTNDNVVGQNNAKENACVGLFKSAYKSEKLPNVMMFYGPSGVGKTEMAKEISKLYKGKLTRIQFSMMQTNNSYNYIFGDTNSKSSLAKDLLTRDSNVILIDEFDKASSTLYNVFYQMFDEGIFEDNTYKVDLSNCVFILTSNFNSEEDMIRSMGMPIYSRINSKIKFGKLSNHEMMIVLDKMFDLILSKLEDDDKKLVEKSKLKCFFERRISHFNNVRFLNKELENCVYKLIMKNKLHQES